MITASQRNIRTPLVSAIVPVFNCERYICEAIDSIFLQTYKNIEIIVVDDGSTDQTKEVVLDRYKRKIRFLEQPNSGPSRARNLGILNSKGEYIAFLDADDIWEPDKIRKQIQHMSSNPQYAMSYTKFQSFSEKTSLKLDSEINIDCPEGWIFDELLFKNFITLSSVIVRADCLKKVGLFNESLLTGEDVELFLRVAYCFQIGFINEILVRKRKHDNNLSYQKRSTSGNILGLENLYKYFPELAPGSNRMIRKALGYRCIRKGREFAYYGMRKEAFTYARKAIKYTPLSFKNYFSILLLPARLLKAYLRDHNR
ncbi:MAG: glycosyltransferase family 2 protein [Nitrospirota bacterium]